MNAYVVSFYTIEDDYDVQGAEEVLIVFTTLDAAKNFVSKREPRVNAWEAGHPGHGAYWTSNWINSGSFVSHYTITEVPQGT